jgi:hypothetical protein
MYEPGLSKKDLAEMEAGGFKLSDYPEEVVEIWPENARAYDLFAYMRTQWRGAGFGLIGLDYGPLHNRMARMKLEPAEYDELEADIQIMESAALTAMNDREE